MRMIRSVLLCLLLAATTARAQLDISFRADQSRVLQYESIQGVLTVVNNAGEPIQFGGNQANVSVAFDIEETPGINVEPTGEPLFVAPVHADPGETVSEPVDLLPAYRLRRTGPYTIRARLEWRERVFLSSRVFVDILPGMEIDKLVAAVTGDPQAVHTYSLRTLNRGGSDQLFLRIEDESQGKCYGVLALGRIVRFYKPVMQIDSNGNLHILHQGGPSQFPHQVITPFGEFVLRELYAGSGTSIRLTRSPAGDFGVEGGTLYEPESAPPPPAQPAAPDAGEASTSR